MQAQLAPFGCWIYLCSSRKRRWAKTSRDEFELQFYKNSHPQSKLFGALWLPQCAVRDAQQEHQQPFCLAIDCADGTSDVLVADDSDNFSSLLEAIKIRGKTLHSLPSGGYAHHQHNFMLKDSWTLSWAVIEQQFLTLWKNKGEFDAASRSSSVGGMGGELRPVLVLPLLCATVIQCTDNVTISIDLHQGGSVVSTHFLYLATPESCSSWMAGFIKAVGYDRGTDVAGGTSVSAQSITSLELSFPRAGQVVKTPEPGCLAIAAGETIDRKEPKVLPDIVYGSAQQRAATAVPPLPDKEPVAWAPLPSAELSRLTAALGNPFEAIGSRISASLSWLKERSGQQPVDAAAGVAGTGVEVPASTDASSSFSSTAAPASSAPAQRAGPTSQSLQSVQSLRYRQPSSTAADAPQAATGVEPEAQPAGAPPTAADHAGSLLSSLPLPECLSPPHDNNLGTYCAFTRFTLFAPTRGISALRCSPLRAAFLRLCPTLWQHMPSASSHSGAGMGCGKPR
jgi:hypothetical protein